MGSIFKIPTHGGRTISNTRASKSQLSTNYVKKAVKEAARFRPGKSSGQTKLQQAILRARDQGIDRQELHDELKKQVKEGYLTKENASGAAKAFGLTEERFNKFKTQSQYLKEGRLEERNKRGSQKESRLEVLKNKIKSNKTGSQSDKKQPGSNIERHPNLNISSSTAFSQKEEATQKPIKPASVWTIIDKNNSDAFPENSRKAV